jgi:hypothetical protein
MAVGYIRAREPEVPPLPGLSCDYHLCFPRLPPWATLWRPSGTPGNSEQVQRSCVNRPREILRSVNALLVCRSMQEDDCWFLAGATTKKRFADLWI